MTTYCVDITAYNTLARHRGIGRYATHLARALKALRDELDDDEKLVALVALRGEAAISEELDPAAHELPLPDPEDLAKHYERYFLKRQVFLRRTLAAAKLDVVHFVEGPGSVPSSRYRSVVTCHDLVPLLMPETYLPTMKSELIRRAKDYLRYQLANRVIAISEATARDLDRVIGVARGRVTVVPQGVDHAKFHPRVTEGERWELTRRGLPARYALYVGASDPRKRVPLLLRAYAPAYRATGVPLVLVGDEWRTERWDEAGDALRACPAGAVLPIGEVPDDVLPLLYRHAELHALPSIYEGFGLTVLEAMASGCPVITTRCGSLPEAGGEAARYVTEDSLTELEAAIVDVLSSPGLRDKMRTAGLAHAATFSWEASARRTLEVYRAAAGRREPMRTTPGTEGTPAWR